MKDEAIFTFFEHVQINGATECWPWTGSQDRKGYGQYKGEGAHRAIYRLTHGHIPAGLLVCHHCDNPLCVNPRHLFAGTSVDNARDCQRKGRTANRKLTDKQVLEIVELLKPKMSLKEIAEKYGTNIETIYRIDKGKTWAGVTGRKKLPEYDKLSHRKVCALKRALSRSFLSEKKLAENYNIKYSTLCDIRDGKTWEDA